MISTKFTILSHACLLIERAGVKIVIDPWLIGSCYWRSWWNFPPLAFDEQLVAGVSHVFLSHIHWDHWHGLSLKKYFRNAAVYISKEPNLRSYEDLLAIGIQKITQVSHGDGIDCGAGIKVWMYQFGLHMVDTCLVIETPEVKLLNANDAKIAGLSLQAIIVKHKPFDFALRSHSSANKRICFYVNGRQGEIDDQLHYSRSFKHFMDFVRPRVAVPFASNHCYLHQDVMAYNSYVTNPLRLQQELSAIGGLTTSQLMIMLPGSSWDSEAGFTLAPLTPFEHFESTLASYVAQEHAKLAAYYAVEDDTKINSGTFRRLFQQIQGVPRFVLRRLQGKVFILRVRYHSRTAEIFEIEPAAFRYRKLTDEKCPPGIPIIDIPAVILQDAVLKRMFGHAGISKRVRYYADDRQGLRDLQRFLSVLALIEYRVFPLRRDYIIRILTSYLRRWREIAVYAKAGYLHFVRKMPLWKVEERILAVHNHRSTDS